MTGIDQTNIAERNHQVGLMDRIYSRARFVRICMHDPWTPSSTESLNYGQLFRSLQGLDNETQCIPQWMTITTARLVSLQYFNRVWVVQEVALAKQAYLSVNGHELLLTAAVLGRLRFVYEQKTLDIPALLKWNPGELTDANILVCLYTGIRSNATDPRDKVFAVLSLMEPKARSLIPVDYAMDYESVYAYAVVAVIKSQQNLDILSYTGNLTKPLSEQWRTAPGLHVQRLN
jgi:hypothetical protein